MDPVLQARLGLCRKIYLTTGSHVFIASRLKRPVGNAKKKFPHTVSAGSHP